VDVSLKQDLLAHRSVTVGSAPLVPKARRSFGQLRIPEPLKYVEREKQ
jgi:hypothetical protein